MSVDAVSKRIIEQASRAGFAGAAKSDGGLSAPFSNALQQASAALLDATAPSGRDNAADLPRKTVHEATDPRLTAPRRQAEDDSAVQRRRREDDRDAARDDRDRDTVSRADTAEAGDGRAEAADERAATQDGNDDGRARDESATDQQSQSQTQAQSQAQPQDVPAPVIAPPPAPVQTAATEPAPTPAADPLGLDAAGNGAAALLPPPPQGGAEAPPAPAETANAEAQTAGMTAVPAAQAQAEDMARRLDDTGAQLKVQVAVSDTAVDAPLPQGVAAVATGPQTGADANAGQGNPQQGNGQNAGPMVAAQPAPVPPNAAQAQGAAAPQAFKAAVAEAAVQDVEGAAPQNSQPGAALASLGAGAGAQRAQAPQAAQAPRQPQMPQSAEVMEQVSVHIAKHGKDGGNSIKVQLKPVELGTIEIKVDVNKDGSVTAMVSADNKETLELLKKDQSSLQKALEQAGLKTDSGSMSFNLREGSQQAGQQEPGGGAVARRRARMAAAAAADAASAKAAATAQARWGVGRSGVDIQV